MFATNTPMALPGTCIMCPGSVRRWFIDTEIQIEWYGAILICDECVTHMGHLFGMKTQAEVDILVTTLAEKEDVIYELQKQLAALEGVRDGLVAGGWVAPDSARMLDVPSPADERVTEPTSDQGSDVGAERGETPQSVHDEVMARLRPDATTGSVLDI